MTVQSFTFNPFSTNCFVCHDGTEAVIIDPSSSTDAETKSVLDYVASNDLSVREILLTHAHIDHIFGCSAVCEALGVGLRVHRSETELLAAAKQQGAMFGVSIDVPPAPSGFLAPGDTISVGESRWDVLHTPGHSPGSVSFVDRQAGFVISGDVLFYDSIGRTDLWQGSLPVLMRSIFEQLVPLGDEMVVYSGHGPKTTIGRERRENPFLAA